jgi:hypothetical protein
MTTDETKSKRCSALFLPVLGFLAAPAGAAGVVILVVFGAVKVLSNWVKRRTRVVCSRKLRLALLLSR